MNGIALTVLVSQLPALFGFSAGGDDLIGEGRAFVAGLAGGQVNLVASSLGVGTLAAILLLKRLPRARGPARGRRRGRRRWPSATSTPAPACRCSARCRRACRPSRCR